jgi:hypothetical protein
MPRHGIGRILVPAVMLALALAYAWLARDWAAAAEKAAPRLEAARAAGEWAAVKDFAAYGMHRFAWLNAGICLALALAAPLWHRCPPTPAFGESTPPAAGRWWFWAGVLAVVALGTALRLPLASGGLWHDEVLQLKRVHGYFQIAGDGSAKFREAPWVETWFHYRKPVNHTVLAVPARASLEAWRAATGAPRHEFSELAFRLPSLLATAGCFVFTALAGRRLGLGAGGVLAALLLALHPWALRWGVDARAYAIGMFATALALWSLAAALQEGRWRWWCIFGLAQFILLWASLLNVWLAGALFLAAAAAVLWQRRARPAGPQLSRLFAVNAVAATLFLQVMGPNLLQFAHASSLTAPADEAYPKLTAESALETASNLLLGLPQRVPAMPGDRLIVTGERLFAAQPAAGHALLAAHGLLLVAGALALRRAAPALVLAVFGRAARPARGGPGLRFVPLPAVSNLDHAAGGLVRGGGLGPAGRARLALAAVAGGPRVPARHRRPAARQPDPIRTRAAAARRRFSRPRARRRARRQAARRMLRPGRRPGRGTLRPADPLHPQPRRHRTPRQRGARLRPAPADRLRSAEFQPRDPARRLHPARRPAPLHPGRTL